jgi:hypothetical protein
LTEDGYLEHVAHIKNIEKGLFWLENNADDLHIGALSQEQNEKFWQLQKLFDELKGVLLTGDGESD